MPIGPWSPNCSGAGSWHEARMEEHHEEQMRSARQIIRDLLQSADCEWENKNQGHDWAQACVAARQYLNKNIIAGETPPPVGTEWREKE